MSAYKLYKLDDGLTVEESPGGGSICEALNQSWLSSTNRDRLLKQISGQENKDRWEQEDLYFPRFKYVLAKAD